MSLTINSITPSNTTDDTTRIRTTSIQLTPKVTGKGSTQTTDLSVRCMFEGDDSWVNISGLDSSTLYPFQLKYISASGTDSSTVITHKDGRRAS